MVKLRNILIISLLLIATCFTEAKAQNSYSGSQIIASFIYRFTQYIDWPKNKVSNGKIDICSVGKTNVNEVADYLREIISLVKGTKNIILHENVKLQTREISKCEILYLKKLNDAITFDTLLKLSKKHHIVTVSDRPDFTRNGGMLGIIIEEGEDPVIEVNVTTMKVAKVTINAILLDNSVLYH